MNEIEKRLERIRAAQDCRNLAGKFSLYYTAGRFDDLCTLWSGTDACRFGEISGMDAVSSYFHSLWEVSPVDIHADALDTEILEVAADCMTAEGMWVSPGSVTIPKTAEHDSAVDWSWKEYRYHFVKTDAGWKIETLDVKDIFSAGYTGGNYRWCGYDASGMPEVVRVGACDDRTNELSARVDKLVYHQECRNLMNRYVRLCAAGGDVSGLWASKDQYLICPSGEYYGEDAAKTYPAPGALLETDTECLEIGDDLCTANGSWNSPGSGEGKWYWGKFEVIFVREGDEWKIQRLCYFPVFRTPMDVAWVDSNTDCYDMNEAMKKIDCRWGPDVIFPVGRPEPSTPGGPYTKLSVD